MASDQIKLPTEGADLAAHANQFLTFTIADEEYGVDILKVQEIKGYISTTRLPNSPPELTGVLNLRGTIVPIVDLRKKFNLPEIQYDQFTVIVVVVVQERVMGMIVDSVSEVMNIQPEEIQPPPNLGQGASANTLRGLGKVGDKLIILLDIDAVLLGDTATAIAA